MELLLLILLCGLIYNWRKPSWLRETISAEEYEELCKKYGRPKDIPGSLAGRDEVREFRDTGTGGGSGF